MNEFARYLGQRGHQVRIICSRPGRGGSISNPGWVADYHRSLWHPSMARLGLLEYHLFPFTTYAALLRERFDVMHCFNFTDALAAAYLPRRCRPVIVLHLNCIPPDVPYRRVLSLGGAVLRRAVQAADEIITVSRQQHQYFEKRCGRTSTTIYVPVNTETFALSTRRDHDRPTILCASALEDQRKGGRVLMRAFNLVKETRPTAVLEISSQVNGDLQSSLLDLVAPQWRSDVHFHGPGDLDDLPALLGRAAVVVLPSLWEAFSMVLMESWATGTPVVTTEQSGSQEVLDLLVGRTFEPGPIEMAGPSNVEGLAQAIIETLELSSRPETPGNCRSLAERFAWPVLGPSFEDVFRRALERRRHRK